MKIVCDACQAKYSIADDKIQGKAFKIRCKKCGHIIVVKPGGEVAAASSPVSAAVAVEKPQAAALRPLPRPLRSEQAVWHVVVDGEQVGPLTEAEVKDRLRAGQDQLGHVGLEGGFRGLDAALHGSRNDGPVGQDYAQPGWQVWDTRARPPVELHARRCRCGTRRGRGGSLRCADGHHAGGNGGLVRLRDRAVRGPGSGCAGPVFAISVRGCVARAAGGTNRDQESWQRRRRNPVDWPAERELGALLAVEPGSAGGAESLGGNSSSLGKLHHRGLWTHRYPLHGGDDPERRRTE